MANELEHIDDTGLTIYAKPLPLVHSPWATDAVAITEVASTGYYAADVATPAQTYLVYQQLGGSPNMADAPPIAAIDRTPAAILASTDLAAQIDAMAGENIALLIAGLTGVTGIDTLDGSVNASTTTFPVTNSSNFTAGDLLRAVGSAELVRVAAVAGDDLTVQRGVYNTTPEAIGDGAVLLIVGRRRATLAGESVTTDTASREASRANVSALALEATAQQIAAKTDNLPNDPAGISNIPTTAQIEAALLNDGDGQQLINAILTVINNNLDVPALELQAIAAQVRTELTTELARIDANISTRLATAGYTAPDNAVLATIAGLMPTDGRKIAGEGDTAKNLDQVEPGTLYLGTVVVSTPAASPASISITRGDGYLHANGRAFHFASASWPNLTGATVVFSAKSRATGQADIAGLAMTVVTSEVVRLELTSAHTVGLQLGSGAYTFDIQATLSTGSTVTLMTGTLNVARDVTP